MSKVNADPRDLRALADRTQRASQEIQSALAGVSAALARAQWDDPQRRRFEEQFSVMRKSAASFATQSAESALWLRRKAAELEKFLGS